MKFFELERITIDPDIMDGKPCIRGMKITVGTITGLIGSGISLREILELYPFLEEDDIDAVISYINRCAREYELRPLISHFTRTTARKIEIRWGD